MNWPLLVVAIIAAVLLGLWIGVLEGKRQMLETLTQGTHFVLLDAWTGLVSHGAPHPDATFTSSVPRCDTLGWHEGAQCGLLREVRLYNLHRPPR